VAVLAVSMDGDSSRTSPSLQGLINSKPCPRNWWYKKIKR